MLDVQDLHTVMRTVSILAHMQTEHEKCAKQRGINKDVNRDSRFDREAALRNVECRAAIRIRDELLH
jgi:hypothetical protein